MSSALITGSSDLLKSEDLLCLLACVPRNLSHTMQPSTAQQYSDANSQIKNQSIDVSTSRSQANFNTDSVDSFCRFVRCLENSSKLSYEETAIIKELLHEEMFHLPFDDNLLSCQLNHNCNGRFVIDDASILMPTDSPIFRRSKSSEGRRILKIPGEKTPRFFADCEHNEITNAVSPRKSVKFSDKPNQIRCFVAGEGEPPRIPCSVKQRLNLTTDRSHFALRGTKYFASNFCRADVWSPSGECGGGEKRGSPALAYSDDFQARLLQSMVCLEGARLDRCLLTGSIAVVNRAFEKTVTVRCSLNNWATFADYSASWIQQSTSLNGRFDRFSFLIVLPTNLVVGDKVQFAVSYQVAGSQFWDNNQGHNYVFECFAKTAAFNGEDFWVHFL